jgi:two-component system sensor histidine kinase YesM
MWNYFLWFLALGVILLFSYMVLQLVHRPLKKLVKAFKMVEIGNFASNLQHHNRDEFNYLYSKFNQMVGKLKVLVQEVYEQTIQRQQAELRQLQSQINPHFLYNSLYLLYRMSQDRNFAGVSYLSRHLGDYFKYITQENADDFITLHREINHARSYSAIQQLRFGDRISFIWEVPEEASDPLLTLQRNVPRLFIQPLIENAIVHGHEDTVAEGWIRLAVNDCGEFIEITVEDNGRGIPPDQMADLQRKLSAGYEEKGHALFNVHKRLQMLFGAGSGLRLAANPHGGLSILITIYWEGGRSHD